MEICKDIHIIASGDTGFSLSNAFDCTVYLIDGGDGNLALVDTGAGIEPDAMEAAIKQAGFNPQNIRTAFLTHGHADHSAGAYHLHTRYGTTVLAAADTANFITSGNRSAIGLDDAIRAGVYPPNYSFNPCPVTPLANGQSTKVGRYTVIMLETPGHCDGHACYLIDHPLGKMLFSGDLIFPGGRILLQLVRDCKIPAHAQSISKMAGLKIDVLLPGHANFLLQRGYKALDKAEATFNTMAIPLNFM